MNHFAGSGYFTNKASLAGAKFSFMPRSYRIPQEAELFRKEVWIVYTGILLLSLAIAGI